MRAEDRAELRAMLKESARVQERLQDIGFANGLAFGNCPRCGTPVVVVARGDEVSMRVTEDEIEMIAVHHCPVPLEVFTATIGFSERTR